MVGTWARSLLMIGTLFRSGARMWRTLVLTPTGVPLARLPGLCPRLMSCRHGVSPAMLHQRWQPHSCTTRRRRSWSRRSIRPCSPSGPSDSRRRAAQLSGALASQAPPGPLAVSDPGASWWRPALRSTCSSSAWAAVGVLCLAPLVVREPCLLRVLGFSAESARPSNSTTRSNSRSVSAALWT